MLMIGLPTEMRIENSSVTPDGTGAVLTQAPEAEFAAYWQPRNAIAETVTPR